MANKYTGEKCIVCGEAFKDNDDIVVCPDCGTPYHKSCWPEDDVCVNQALHESGDEWKPKPRARFILPEGVTPVRCKRCGTENAPGQRFCGECGLPLDTASDDEIRPFNNVPNNNYISEQQDNDEQGAQQDGFAPGMGIRQIRLTAQSDLDGIKLGDFFDYIGNRSITLITNFVKFAKTGTKLSFNIAAFFFPEFYFFYRRMPKQGVLFMIMTFILNIPNLILYGQTGTFGQVFFNTDLNPESNDFRTILQMCSLLSLSIQLIAAFFANYWYYKQARKDISQIRAVFGEKEPDVVTKEKIRGAGGTSWSAVIGAIAVEMILALGFFLVMAHLY